MLESQTVEIPFTGGVDTKTDPKQVAVGDFLTLENAIFTTLKKLRKRNGYTALGKSIIAQFTYAFPSFTGSVAAGSFLADYNDEQVMGDGMNLLSYSAAEDKFVYKGRCESAQVTVSPIFQNQYHQLNPDSAVNLTSGYRLFAWESWTGDPLRFGTYSGVQYALYDSATGQEIFNVQLGNTTSKPKCMAIGSLLYLVYFDSGSSALKAFSVTSGAAGSPITLASNIDATTPNYDFVVNGTAVYVAYNGTGSTVKVQSYNSALTSTANASKSEIASNGIGVFQDASNNVWVAYNNSTETKAFVLNSTLASTVLAPTVIDAGATATAVQNVTGAHDGTRAIILYDQPGLPELGQDTGTVLNGTFLQPAVGATVVATKTGTYAFGVGQLVYVVGGGYYRATGGVGAASNTVALTNLGFSGNAAPGATVPDLSQIFPAYAYSNAVINYNTLTAAGAVGTVSTFARSVALSSRAFISNGIIHALICHDATLQPTYFLASLYNISSLEVVQIAHFPAKVLESEAGGIPTHQGLCNANLTSAGHYQFALAKRFLSNLSTSANTPFLFFFNSIFSTEINLAPTELTTKNIGGNLHMGLGTLMMYDGNSVVEHGFHLYPENVTAVVGTTTAGLASGQYGYRAVYSWIDTEGQVHRSAPSPVISVNNPNAGTGQFTVTIPMLRITQKGSVIIELYRTLKDGTTYFRVDTVYTTYPKANSLTTSYAVFVDAFEDGTISGNEQLYTGGELENIAVPSPRYVSSAKNRLYVVPADQSYAPWYSKQVVPGSPVEFTDAFVQNTDQGSGTVVATVELDDKNIFFKGNRIYYVVGSGPAPSGANNDFSDPIPIPVDVGLIDPRSIVVFPGGIMFKSAKGIYLLDRSLAVSYIGAKVEAYNSYNVLSASLIATNNQIRFLLSSGQALVYDYLVGTWAVFTNHSGVSAISSGNVYYYLKSDGTVMKETAGIFTDNGTFVKLKAVTTWLALAKLQGFQRVRKALILGDYYGAHNLLISAAYDFNSTPTQVITVPGSLVDGVYQWELQFTRQKCDALQLTFEDSQSSAFNEGMSLSSLAFELGVKRGLNKVRASRSYG